MNILLAGEWATTADAAAAEQRAWIDALHDAASAADPAARRWRWCARRGEVPDAQIDVAVVASPPPGALSGLPALRLIQSLWAGVDRLLDDATVPDGVPLARMVDPAMNAAMAETALWATLSLHRGFFRYAEQQRAAQWRPLAQRRADEVPVLVLGLGEMGRATALALQRAGYPVTAWRRSTGAALRPADADMAGLTVIGGPLSAPAAEHRPEPGAQPGQPAPLPPALAKALARTQVLINLLPLTPATRGVIDARLLDALPATAGVVNLARGAHVVEADLRDWLVRRPEAHAVLDVFPTEPLPPSHGWWRHPQVTVLPHAAAQTDRRSAAAVAVDNLLRLSKGQPLRHRVDRPAGY